MFTDSDIVYVRSSGATTEHVEISPVSVPTAVSPLLLEALHDGHTSEVDSDFTVLHSARSLFSILEVDDGETTIFEIVAHLHRHEATLYGAELLDDGLDKIFFCDAARDVRQLDSSGVWDFLLLILGFSCSFGNDGFHVENALFGTTNLRGSVLVLTLVLLQVLDTGLKLSDLVTLDIAVSFLGLFVTHLRTEILLSSLLEVEVGMPDVVSVEHSDVLVTPNGVITSADAKRVKNWVF